LQNFRQAAHLMETLGFFGEVSADFQTKSNLILLIDRKIRKSKNSWGSQTLVVLDECSNLRKSTGLGTKLVECGSLAEYF